MDYYPVVYSYPYGYYRYPESTSVTIYQTVPDNDVVYVSNGTETMRPTTPVTEGTTGNAAVASPPPAYPSDDGFDPLYAGHRLFADERYADAQRHYFNAITLDPNDAYANLFFGVSAIALEQYPVAAASIGRALDLLPELIESPIDIRSVYADKETFEDQLEELVDYAEDHEDDLQVQMLSAYVHFASAQPEEALEILHDLKPAMQADELVVRLKKAVVGILTNRNATQ